MKFIHTADIHLGAAPDRGSAWSKQREQEIWQTFRRLIGEANREKADLLLIAGDLFHRQPQYQELREVNYLFGTLKKTRVVLMAGNHDCLERDSLLRDFAWEKNVFFLREGECQRICFRDLGASVYGFSYDRKEISEPLYDDLIPEREKGCHILLAHGGDERHIPMDFKRLGASGFDYIALGHIHKPQSVVPNRIVYAGALEPIDINDTGEHGYVVGECLPGRVRARFVPFACRSYIHLTLKSTPGMTDFAMQEQLARAISEQGRQNIYKVELAGYRDAGITYRTEQYASCGCVAEVLDLTEPDYDLEQLCALHQGDVIGRYIRALLPDGPKQASPAAMRALRLGLKYLLP